MGIPPVGIFTGNTPFDNFLSGNNDFPHGMNQKIKYAENLLLYGFPNLFLQNKTMAQEGASPSYTHYVTARKEINLLPGVLSLDSLLKGEVFISLHTYKKLCGGVCQHSKTSKPPPQNLNISSQKKIKRIGAVQKSPVL